MNEKSYNKLMAWLRYSALIIAGIIGVFLLVSFYEPIDVKVDIERVEQDVREKSDNDRFPDIEHGGWV